MKKSALLAVLALSLGAGFPGGAMADYKDKSPAEREKHLDKMATDLKLSQDQKNKIRTIKDEKYRKIDEAKRDAQNDIRGVLTPEQQTKYDKMIADK